VRKEEDQEQDEEGKGMLERNERWREEQREGEKQRGRRREIRRGGLYGGISVKSQRKTEKGRKDSATQGGQEVLRE
jgi:hypothetical protein